MTTLDTCSFVIHYSACHTSHGQRTANVSSVVTVVDPNLVKTQMHIILVKSSK